MPELDVQLKPPELLPEKIAHLFYRLTLGLVKRRKVNSQAEPADSHKVTDKPGGVAARTRTNFFFGTIEFFFNIFEPAYSSAVRFLSAKTSLLADNVKTILNKLADGILKTGESVYLSLFSQSRQTKQPYKFGLDEATKQRTCFFIIGLLGFLLAKGVAVLSPRHIVIFAIMPICIFLIFLKPIYALMFYLIMSLSLIQKTIWNFPNEIGGIPLYMGTPLLLAAILSWLFEVVRERRKFKVLKDTSYLPLIGFWSFLVFSYTFQPGDPDVTSYYLQAFLAISSFLVCYTAITHIIGDNEAYYKFMTYTIAGIYGYFAYQTIRMAAYYGFNTQYTVTAELDGRLSDNNELAAVINMTFPLFYCLYLNQKKKSMQALFLGLFVLAIAAIIYTHSRGGLLCLAITGGLLFFRVMLPRAKNKVFPVVLLCVLVMLGSYVFSKRITERVQSIIGWKTDPSAQKRILSLVVGLNMMKENPFLGAGIGSMNPYKNVFLDYCPDELTVRTNLFNNDFIVISKPSQGYEIHNAYLSLGGRAGIPALIFFIMFIIYTIKKMRKFRRKIGSDPKTEWAYNISYAIEIGIIAFMISGMFLNSFADGTIYVLFAMATTLYNVVLKPEDRLNKGVALWVLVLFVHWLYFTVLLRA